MVPFVKITYPQKLRTKNSDPPLLPKASDMCYSPPTSFFCYFFCYTVASLTTGTIVSIVVTVMKFTTFNYYS